MLNHPLLAGAMTPAHRRLQAACDEFFTEDGLRAWRGPDGYLRKPVWREMAQRGLMGAAIDPAWGGQGLGLLGGIVLKKSLSGLADYGLSMAFHVQSDVAANWLLACPNDTLKQRYLRPVVTGELISCTCYTEQAPSSPSTLRDAGSHLVLDARKAFVVNGLNADICIVTADLDGRQATVLVDKHEPGVRVAQVFDRFGSGAIEQVALHFDGVRVDRGNIVSDHALGSLLLWNRVMTHARFSIALDAHFLLEKVLAKLVRYARTRTVGGRLLSDWPVNAAVITGAALRRDAGVRGLLDLYAAMQGRSVPVMQAAMLKRYCVQAAHDLCVAAVEMEGGMGMMHDGRFLGDLAQAMALRMASGSQVVLADLVARHLQQRHDLGL